MIKNKKEFIQYFNNTIIPKYEQEVEKGRATKQELLKLNIKAFLIFALCSCIFVFLGPLIIVGFLIGLYIVIRMYKKSGILEKTARLIKTKEAVFNDIIPKVLPGFSYSAQHKITQEEFESYAFVHRSMMSRFHSEDTIIGTFGERNVRISEVNISKAESNGDTTRYVTVFSGLVTEYDLGSDYDFNLFVTREKYYPRHNAFFFGKNESDLFEISLAHPFMDKNYVILSNDDIKTNRFLQPRIIEAFQQFIEKQNKIISFGITNGKMIILTENKDNIFEIFNYNQFDAETIWNELMSIIQTLKYIQKLSFIFQKI